MQKFPLAPMGAIAPGSAHGRPSAEAPIDTSGKCSIDFSPFQAILSTFSFFWKSSAHTPLGPKVIQARASLR
jgi:hypothetical protein